MRVPNPSSYFKQRVQLLKSRQTHATLSTVNHHVINPLSTSTTDDFSSSQSSNRLAVTGYACDDVKQCSSDFRLRLQIVHRWFMVASRRFIACLIDRLVGYTTIASKQTIFNLTSIHPLTQQVTNNAQRDITSHSNVSSSQSSNRKFSNRNPQLIIISKRWSKFRNNYQVLWRLSKCLEEWNRLVTYSQMVDKMFDEYFNCWS
jgi:hypothetical protein